MNFLKKGPELKLSELKVPDFLYDLFYDLKERHLLPLVVLLLVAMVAAPIYFKNSTKSEPEPAITPDTTAIASSAGNDETLVVARSEPGLRDYKRRLRHYRPIDPFAARGGGEEAGIASTEVSSSTPTAAAPEASGSSVEATVTPAESSVATEAPAPIEYPSYEGSRGESEPSPETTTVTKTKTRYASDTIDVRIVTVPHSSAEQEQTKQQKPRAQVRHNLPELTMLPARATPAATYIGLTNDGKRALFVVSSDVVSLFGEGTCVVGSQSCQLLALEPGLPETFVYGPEEKSFRIELLKIDTTLSAKPRRAKLGATEGKNHAKGGGEGGGASNTEADGKEPAERG